MNNIVKRDPVLLYVWSYSQKVKEIDWLPHEFWHLQILELKLACTPHEGTFIFMMFGAMTGFGRILPQDVGAIGALSCRPDSSVAGLQLCRPVSTFQGA